MSSKVKKWFKTLAALMLFFGVAALVTGNVTAALWLTGLFLILGLIGFVIT